jgi:calcineurin-like phosphoesterase family protein
MMRSGQLINRYVQPEDTLYHLGDFVFGSDRAYVAEAERCLARIHCKNVHLIWGNHDKRELTDREGRTIADGFQSAHDLLEISVESQRIVLCHYAMAVWNKSHRGSWQLYGHSHGEAEEWLNTHLPGRRSLDVGVDNAKRLFGEYRPISFDEIAAMFASRTGAAIDHHVDPASLA